MEMNGCHTEILYTSGFNFEKLVSSGITLHQISSKSNQPSVVFIFGVWA